jgi:hypothetical protein
MAKRMQLDYSMLPVKLYPSRLRYGFLTLICIGFTALGVWVILNHLMMGWLLVLLFGAGAVILGISMDPRAAYLEITPEGFVICALFRKQMIPWSEVQDFGVINIRSTKMVVFNLTPESPQRSTMVRVSQSVAGADAGLPTTYGINADHLAAQMNKLLMEYRLAHPQPSSLEALQFDRAE